MVFPNEPTDLRYVRPPRPIHFPSEEEVPETKRHLELRTALYSILKLGFGAHAAVGSDQFVYWDAADPTASLAGRRGHHRRAARVSPPDAFVRLGQPNDLFDTWKVWERGAPNVAVEISSTTDARDALRDQKLEKYRHLGVAEVVWFDPLEAEVPLKVWDHIDGDLVERDLGGECRALCQPLGVFWVVQGDATCGPMLRLARDAEGRELLPTPEEAALRKLESALKERG
jgi:hypothetical protein